MFIVRALIWMAIVVAFIPVNSADLRNGQRQVSTYETLRIAQSVFYDLSAFCDRNEQSCAAGKQIFSQFGVKAKTGLQFVMSAFEDSPEEPAAAKNPSKFDSLKTGAVRK